MTVATLDTASTVATIAQPAHLPVLADPTGGRLVRWADAAEAAYQLAQKLCVTSFCPKAFQNKPHEAAAAILYGDEINFSPLMSLQAIHVINGKPSMYARSMQALVASHGHEIETVSKTDAKVVVRGRRKGSDTWMEETWTTERARRAGYTNNAKYETDPQAMLYARAVSVVCRTIAPDALMGLAYSVEEMELEETPQPTTRVSRSKATTGTTVQRAAIEAPVDGEQTEQPVNDGPAFEDDTTPADPETITEAAEQIKTEVQAKNVPGVTQAQIKMIGVLMKELHITQRDDAIRYCADTIGRPIESRNDLTKDEASQVIESLNADKAAQSAPTPDGQ